MTTIVRCPGCGKQHQWSTGNPWRPFCSERCRLIDLGEWLEERRGIPAEPVTEYDGDSDAQDRSQQH